MPATLSPNAKLRGAFSPTKSPLFIGSNDDKLERAQARAARAAAIRRKPTFSTTSVSSVADQFLGKELILELFQNCIKIASENKINQKNTWELNLIDHICEIINVEEENDTETNFQKASCTLEAGVKIYSMRVDSVHSEAYKVLGGINRAGREDEQDESIEDVKSSSGHEAIDEKEKIKKLSPVSTLEPSFVAINVKKFDVAFVVDPLYHQTSAQFDEGGAKGLLLINLGVYYICCILFDSLEVPGKCSSPDMQCNGSETIDLSFVSECTQQMVLDMLNSSEISPTLGAIVNQFDKDDQRPTESYSLGRNLSGEVNTSPDDNVELNGDTLGNSGAWDFDHDDQSSVVDDGTYDEDAFFPVQQEDHDMAGDQSNLHYGDEDKRFGDVDSYLFQSLGFSTKQNAWAGPDHWKFRKVHDPEVPAEQNGSPKPKKAKNKKADLEFDFSNALDADISHIFDPPKNPKSLLLPSNRAPCNTKLPEDCHYQPESLVKLFLSPDVLCIGGSGPRRTDEEHEHADEYGATSWDDDGFDGAFDDGHAYSDIDESSTLISQPRQVNKVEVQYDKTSKQVDVHRLKETLWDQLQPAKQTSVDEEETAISFNQVLSSFPEGCRAAASINDISPHLCFICLLHLANEHGLRILGCPGLDDLSVYL